MINELMKRLSELPNITLSDGQEYIQLYDAMETVKGALGQEPSRDMEEIEEVINCDANAEIKLKMISNIVYSESHYFKTLEQEPKTVKSCDTCKHDEAFGCPSFIHDRCENYSEWEQADKSKGKALEQESSITWVTGADGAKIAFWDVPVWKVTKICEILGEPYERSE